MIYTSYFAKYKGENGVSIARFKPKWFNGPEYLDLAPSVDLLTWWKNCDQNDESNKMQYIESYYNMLFELDPRKVYEELEGKVLLCYEKVGTFCHRHLVTMWLRQFGYECKEL